MQLITVYLGEDIFIYNTKQKSNSWLFIKESGSQYLKQLTSLNEISDYGLAINYAMPLGEGEGYYLHYSTV